jgi:hypothetical protein
VFGELSTLFGRNFAVGFLLPAAIFAISSLFLTDSFKVFAPAHSPLHMLVQTDKEVLGATAFLFALWMGGILLLALNRSIIRFKEGYGKLNPAKLIAFMEEKRFEKLNGRIEAVEADIQAAEAMNEEPDPSLIKERTDLRTRAAERFPDSERLLLPTAFGNTIRAFEVYPRVMYGLDAIPSWPRLLMVMSDNDREAVDAAKAQMSFWVNIWFLSLFFFVEYLALSVFTGMRGTPWALLSLLLAWIASSRSRNAAIMWGEVVKASFDVYMPQLRKKLELDATLNPDQERNQWVAVSRAMIYRNPDFLPYYRERNESEKNIHKGD